MLSIRSIKLKHILYGVAGAAGSCLILSLGIFIYLTHDLPSLNAVEEYSPNLITKVYARDGQVIGEFYLQRRIVVSLEVMPGHLKNAFLSVEDAKFYEHGGIDYLAILRTIYKNFIYGERGGASTITQQVAKTFFLSPEKRYSRKIREAVLAKRMEKSLSKEDILYLYLNQIYFGSGAYGVQAASETYFGKDVTELTVAESALLAGLPQAPSRFSPYINPEAARKRQVSVLRRMNEEGHITREAREKALSESIKFKSKKVDSMWVGSYFTEHVRRHVEEKFGEELLYKGGLQIYTTLDVDMQVAANEAVTYGLRNHDARRGYRGPIKTIQTTEEFEEFTQETDRHLERFPIQAGKYYHGVITSIDEEDKTLYVSVGSRSGKIPYRYFKWANIFNPTNDPDGGIEMEPITLFKEGDVIEVSVRRLPDDELSPITFKLTQEPLAEASLLAIEPATGYVTAMVGGSSFKKTQFNRVIQSKRQPGSAFKPIIYATALDSGYTPATIVIDSPLVYENVTKKEVELLGEDALGEGKGLSAEMEEQQKAEEEVTWLWKPRNYEDKFYGPTTIRTALTKSRNVVTVKVLQDVGVTRAINYARKLGIESPLAKDLSLSLGSSGITLLELTTAYATFENLGKRPEPIFITRITDRDGELLEGNQQRSEQVITPQIAYLMTSLLEGVVQHGTAWRVRVNLTGRPAAGKTGTTNNLNDAWFMGYTPELVVGTWIGYDSEKPLGKNETGSKAASPIWIKFMKKVLENTPPKKFPMPEGLEFARIDPETGLLANATTPDPVFEVFVEGTAPIEISKRRAQHPDTEFFKLDIGDERVDEEPREFRDTSEEEAIDLNEPL